MFDTLEPIGVGFGHACCTYALMLKLLILFILSLAPFAQVSAAHAAPDAPSVARPIRPKPNTDEEKAEFINSSRSLSFSQGLTNESFGSLRTLLLPIAYPVNAQFDSAEARNARVLLDQLPIFKKILQLERRFEGRSHLSVNDALLMFNPFKQACDELQKIPNQNLSEIEAVSICLYTMDAYKPLAVALSSGNAEKIKGLQGFIDNLDNALRKLPKYRGTVIHKQTLSESQLERFMPGYRFRVPTYLSTSREKVENNFSGNVELIITSVEGRNIEGLSANFREGEVLLLRNSRFEVIDRDGTADGITKIYLKQLVGRDD